MAEPSTSYSLSSRSEKKRPRSPNESDERPPDKNQTCTSLDDDLLFNDTMIALQLMRTQFPKLEKNGLMSIAQGLEIINNLDTRHSTRGTDSSFGRNDVTYGMEGVVTQPFILQSQLYSSVKDRTQVDRDLESMKKDKVLRIFKLSSGQDDHAIMFMDDYLKQVASAVKRSGGRDQDGGEVFEWFEKYVIYIKLDVSINQQELFSLLSRGGDVTDKHITLLMNAGLLTRQLIDPNIYWLAIPSIGPILKGLSQGRKEILSLLNRKKYKEMLLSSLEKTKLRLSPLDTRFLLRDLIGSGHIKTVQTPTGLLARISRD